jgi:cobaltochelatase CobT
VSPFAIARRLRRLFQGVERDGWRSGEEEGVLDAARLGQVIANPMNRAVFRQERYRPTAPAVVMFLLDNSGSMKRQRHETLAVLVDTLSRALDLAGAKSEILGFTTASWNGGEPRNEWRRAGEPAGPGRLAETSHIIYKDADTSWKRSRLAVASLMRTQHFRESVDGEAIIWAYRRLMERPEPRRLLVILSDGAPTEAATRYANDGAYLERHLRDVVHFIEREGAIEIGAISVDEPVDSLFMRSVEMDLAGTLTLGEYGLLETLFGGRR